jgi:DNA adenine methylase
VDIKLNKEQEPVAKPFLKWAGGKSQLLPAFEKLFPTLLKEGKIKNYFEPFLGSGAVFFHIMQQYKVQNAWLYDTNPNLIITYKCVQQYTSSLIDELNKIQTYYHQLNKEKQAAYFYNIRNDYNQQTEPAENNKKEYIKRAVQFIFLNRTCFNGLYRVNSKGLFNTPAGSYNNPLICDEDNLMAVAKILQKAFIKHADFFSAKKDIKKNSFLYFDPPYRPITKTANFNSYAKDVFDDTKQIELAGFFTYVSQKGGLAMLSNSDPKNHKADDDFFDLLYKSYYIKRIPAKRMINANAAKRGLINEIIVTNYPI